MPRSSVSSPTYCKRCVSKDESANRYPSLPRRIPVVRGSRRRFHAGRNGTVHRRWSKQTSLLLMLTTMLSLRLDWTWKQRHPNYTVYQLHILHWGEVAEWVCSFPTNAIKCYPQLCLFRDFISIPINIFTEGFKMQNLQMENKYNPLLLFYCAALWFK